MKPARRVWLPRLLALALILYFWAVGLANLDRFPSVQEDEPWIAAPGYSFWDKGTFGTRLFAGYYGMETHYYDFPPLFSLLLGAALHLFGMGLFQARILPLACMTLTLALTYRAGIALFSAWHGVIAVGVLVTWRVALPVLLLYSGIPLADVARIARYDAAVPLFGLSALVVLIAALRKPTWRRFFVVGVLAALAMLCQVYGAFWLGACALPILARFRLRGLKYLAVMLLAFCLTLMPWLLFIASGGADFANQDRYYGQRFSFFDPQFYVTNLTNEGQRYQPLLSAASHTWGTLLWITLLIAGLVWLLAQAVWKREKSAQILLLALAGMVAAFALVMPFKSFSYLATVWSLFALVLAAAWVTLWESATQRGWKVLLILLFWAAVVEGGVRIQAVQARAARATSYRAFTQAIAARLPPNSRVMGLQHYWFGLVDATSDYRSILVPILLTNPLYVEQPVSFREAVETIPPDIMLIDQNMLNLMIQTGSSVSPYHALGDQIRAYLSHAQLIAYLDDPTYGRFLIYNLHPGENFMPSG